MGHTYQAVGWNRQKKIYDRTLALALAAYLAVFVGAGFATHPHATAETLLIRAFGTAAFFLLHVILCIGPAARLNTRFLPLLYNRRHLGVTMFFCALAHGAFSLLQFHAFGDLNPLVSLFASNARVDSLAQFPFQPLGFLALVILFVMAATSHDFWLRNLTAPVWKALHMLVYAAYALITLHVVLGVLQAETNPVFVLLQFCGAGTVIGLHLASARKERGLDVPAMTPADEGWLDVGAVDEIPEKRAKIVHVAGDRVAVFRYDGKVAALSNACQHQNGPLGEGRIIDGCVTCPWHGYQYEPHCGRSPEPFTEQVPTFRTRVVRGRVWLDPEPLPAGTDVEPALIDGGNDDA